ncbi:hypothetical protein BH09MYX1_BH09MYX1_18970 [soil metagenome]
MRPAALRVLMVEDSANAAALLLCELAKIRRPIVHERVKDECGLIAALDMHPWDVVICNWTMPTFSALGALAALEKRRLDVPFIVVAGTEDEAAAVECMRAGAHDYVLEDRLARLVPALERELRQSGRRKEYRKREARFQALIERSAEAISLTDAEGTLTYLSPGVPYPPR